MLNGDNVLKLAVFSMVRNEIDIIEAFLSHLGALFDYAIILDHDSVDGTNEKVAEACKNRSGWQHWRTTIAGYHQRLFSQFALQYLFANTDADAVFFLDADEFLDFLDRDALEGALRRIPRGFFAGQLTWLDSIRVRQDEAPVRIGEQLWARGREKPVRKIIIPRELYELTGGEARPSTGNHSIELQNHAVAYEQIGHILHIPIRSATQLQQKAVVGAMATLARSDNTGREGPHWFDLVHRIASGNLTNSELRGISACYGSIPQNIVPTDISELPRLGFRTRGLNVASAELDFADENARPDPWQILAQVIAAWRAQASARIRLRLDDGQVIAEPDEESLGPATNMADSETLALCQARATALERELAATRTAVHALQTSTSYRITAPLRAVARRLGGLRGPEPSPRNPADISVVVTSCGRHDLLDQTLASFRAFNTDRGVREIIVVEDGAGDPEQICNKHGATLLRLGSRIGQVRAIDAAYGNVETRLIFHLEDDWEFYSPGFIEASRVVIDADPSCIAVSLRAWDDLNGHPLSFASSDESFGVLAFGYKDIWHGFSWNPGLRRSADYRRIAPFSARVESPPDGPGRERGAAEAGIGALYCRLGYRAVVLRKAGYVRHLGWGQTVPWHGPAE